MFIDIGLSKTDNYFRTNYCLVINLKQNSLILNKITYKIKYKLFRNIYIRSLKVCNVRLHNVIQASNYGILHQKRRKIYIFYYYHILIECSVMVKKKSADCNTCYSCKREWF